MTEPTDSALPTPTTFRELNLPAPVLKALDEVGYESPSPIQAATIPPLLAGRDVLGQAQTGTGKTAAFALPILSRIDPTKAYPQALVLAPTRELAIQVAEAFQKYAAHLPGFQILPIYGGQGYGPQLHALRRGVQVVVGTPGRVIDHLNRGTLDLSQLQCLVLDEADEMLRMGFVDDVEAVLQKTPPTRQIALFSATMPAPIRRIAQTHLKDPVEVTIKAKTTTATNIRQRYWAVSGLHKLDALTRILEAEPFDAMIIFARTKAATEELAEKLAARGLAAAAINGDIQQQQRERTIQRLKDGQIDILVATDVAARGLDVERISHVLNYDIPYDTEAYVHRIGRTGRAGRSGDAILFVAPRERGMLRAIERATRQPIESMNLPTVEAVNDQRIARFKQRISDTRAAGGLELFQQLIEQYETEHDVPAVEIAAALARLAQGDVPLLLDAEPKFERHEREKWAERRTGDRNERPARGDRPERGGRSDRPERSDRGNRSDRPERGERPARPPRERDAAAPAYPAAGAPAATTADAAPRIERPAAPPPPRADVDAAARKPARRERSGAPEAGMETFRIEVGHDHGVKPSNIVGAIANEAGLDSANIGRIDIRGDHSLVDLPAGMPSDVFKHLKKVWVSGQQLRITRADEAADSSRPASRPRPGAGPRKGRGK
ncbi:MAG: ATP-dependent RNA helicase [Lysobacterales bacterium 69-70]|nr:DEAD/DEAH box helicase [Xanthomonadaceae bacterium]ODU34068.1 MAG: ATP-dependent RNA helicase [Xanthomonadaceae bacterium SCN 69-320]ODV18762.1 MAG: ATP-dependent RNA helicase [Xanthomonadaceae bacterium SCN 69-25]OJY93033.1 MAG: ATP-dependent RNA helicase [Xanthomonadales bacterium 69-70]